MTGETPGYNPEGLFGEKLWDLIVYYDEFFSSWEDYAVDAGFDPSLEGEVFAEHAREAISNLDALWKETGLWNAKCWVSGTGVWSEFRPQDEAPDLVELIEEQSREDAPAGDGLRQTLGAFDSEEMEGEFSAKECWSAGFTIDKLAGDLTPRVKLQFIIAVARYKHRQTVARLEQHYLFANPEDISLTAAPDVPSLEMHPSSEGMYFPDRTVQMDEVNQRSHELIQLLGSASFQEASRQEQAHAIDELVEKAQAVGEVRGLLTSLQAERGYIIEQEADGIYARPVSIDELTIRGVCLGFAMVGRELLDEQPIRSDNDLVNIYDGLSLAVRLDEDSDMPVVGYPGAVLCIPISSQTAELTFGWQVAIEDDGEFRRP